SVTPSALCGREGVLARGAEVASDGDDSGDGRGRRRGDGELEHPLQALDVHHLGGERDGARLVEAAVSVLLRQGEQRPRLAHPRPRERAGEERLRVAPHRVTVPGRLTL